MNPLLHRPRQVPPESSNPNIRTTQSVYAVPPQGAAGKHICQGTHKCHRTEEPGLHRRSKQVPWLGPFTEQGRCLWLGRSQSKAGARGWAVHRPRQVPVAGLFIEQGRCPFRGRSQSTGRAKTAKLHLLPSHLTCVTCSQALRHPFPSPGCLIREAHLGCAVQTTCCDCGQLHVTARFFDLSLSVSLSLPLFL